MKRFVNRFILDYKLDEASQDLQAELLIKLLIFETYFPEFARLFDVTTEGGKNPIQEFLDFASVRQALRREVDIEIESDVFSFYNTTPGATPAESLERLKAEVPEMFVRLAQDDDFVSLAQSVTVTEQIQIVNKVQRRKERETSVPLAEAIAKSVPYQSEMSPVDVLPELRGRRILWLDDEHDNNTRIVAQLREVGAHVELATGAEDALDVLPAFDPELLISDIGRGIRFEAGFEDLEQLRIVGGYAGPVIFFTARITPKRRAVAKELGAEIVTGVDELFQAILKAVPAVAEKASAERVFPTA
jgi:CheY-like chemotaxis protein